MCVRINYTLLHTYEIHHTPYPIHTHTHSYPLVLQHLGHRRQAVGSAARIGDDLRVFIRVIKAQYDNDRNRDDTPYTQTHTRIHTPIHTCMSGEYDSWLTPITNIGMSLLGAETTTRLAPEMRWREASAWEVNAPVDSSTNSLSVEAQPMFSICV
jgi:hypothetical protein